MECDFKAWQKSAGDSISIDYFVTPAMNAVCKSYSIGFSVWVAGIIFDTVYDTVYIYYSSISKL